MAISLVPNLRNQFTREAAERISCSANDLLYLAARVKQHFGRIWISVDKGEGDRSIKNSLSYHSPI